MMKIVNKAAQRLSNYAVSANDWMKPVAEQCHFDSYFKSQYVFKSDI